MNILRRSYRYFLLGFFLILSLSYGVFQIDPVLETFDVQTASAVPAPVNFGGTDYYRVISTDTTEDTGTEVCAKVGRSCVGYVDESVTMDNVCKAYHPTAVTVTSTSGDGSVTYCNGAPQTGACSTLSNSCLSCPTCTIGINCSTQIGSTSGGLYREAYVTCGALLPPNTPGAPTVTATGTSSYTVIVDTNGNGATVEYAIQHVDSGNYVTSGGGLSGSETWRTYANWGSGAGFAVSGYSQNDQNTFRVKARISGGGPESGFGSSTARYTLVNSVSGVSFSSVTISSLQVNTSGGFSNLGSGSSGLFYNETSGNPGGTDNGWTSSTSYTDGGLSVNTQYSYTVTSRNGDAIQSGSSSSSVYTLANVPAAPTVNNETGSTLDVTIAVNGNPAGTQFAIQETNSGDYVQASGALGASEVWQTNATWGVVTVTGLSTNTSYTFQVKARNGNNVETAFGPTASGTTFISVPGTPTVDAPALNTLDVSIDENGNPATVTYVIQEVNSGDYVQANGSLGAVEVWQDAATWSSPVTVTGLSVNTSYEFRVKARNAALVETAYSTGASLYTLIETPTGVSIDIGGTVSIQMSATGALSNLTSGSSGLEFEELSGNPGGSDSAILQTNSYTDAGLSLNTVYEYRVRAYNGDGVATPYSASTQATTFVAVPGASLISNPTINSIDVDINVNSNPPVTEFAIQEFFSGLYVQANGSLGLSEVWQNVATWSTVTVTGLSSNEQYFFRVKARSQDLSESAFGSLEGSYTLMPDPTGLNITNVTTNSIEMAAQGSFPNLAVGSSGINFDETGGASGATDSGYLQQTTYTDSGLAVNTAYTYEVTARNADAVDTLTVAASAFTLANIPGAPTVDTPQASTLDVEITDVNGNPASTEFAIEARQDASLLGYVQANGTINMSEVWQTASAWSTVTVTGLDENQTYSFRVKARNGDDVETAFSGTTSAYTAVDAPTNFQTTSIDEDQMSFSVDSFPRDTEGSSGYFFSQDAGPDSGWQSGINTWDVSSLALNTSYTHRVKYRNAESVETIELVNTDFTYAEVPSDPIVSTPTISTLDIVISPNGNPASTEFAIQNSLTGEYVQAGLTLGVSEAWQTYAAWGGVSGFTLSGLSEATSYQIRVKARNGDDVETAFSNSVAGLTTATPTITAVSDTPEPVYHTTPVTFTVDWEDADLGDQVQIHVCQTNALTGTSCTGGSWCDSVGYTTDDPVTCDYTTQIGEGLEDYFVFVCDDEDNCSSSTAGVFTVSDNLAPEAPTALFINDALTGAQAGLDDAGDVPRVSSREPVVSAICEDPDVVPDTLVSYQLQYASDPGFGDIIADSGSETAMTACLAGSRSEDLVFPSINVLPSGTFYWRLKFWDQSGLESPYASSSFQIPGGRRRRFVADTNEESDAEDSGTSSAGTSGSTGGTNGSSSESSDGLSTTGSGDPSDSVSESSTAVEQSSGLGDATETGSSSGEGGLHSSADAPDGSSGSSGGLFGSGVEFDEQDSGLPSGGIFDLLGGVHRTASVSEVVSAQEQLDALVELFQWMSPNDYHLLVSYEQLKGEYQYFFRLKDTLLLIGRGIGLTNGVILRVPEFQLMIDMPRVIKLLVLSTSYCFTEQDLLYADRYDVNTDPYWWAIYALLLEDVFDIYELLEMDLDGLNSLDLLQQVVRDRCLN